MQTIPEGSLDGLDTRTLLRNYAETLTILMDRGVIRTRNAPAGDLGETLVAAAYGGHLAPNSTKSWDVGLPDGTRVQVKCRVIGDGMPRGQVYSPFRSWDFDRCVFVQFDAQTYGIRGAADVPVDGCQSVARPVKWVAGERISLHTDLLALPGALDVTDKLAQALEAL